MLVGKITKRPFPYKDGATFVSLQSMNVFNSIKNHIVHMMAVFYFWQWTSVDKPHEKCLMAHNWQK